MTTNNPTAHEFLSGDMRATVWGRRVPEGAFHMVTFARRSRQNGEWHDTNAFSSREMRDLSAVLKQARAWMRSQGDPA